MANPTLDSIAIVDKGSAIRDSNDIPVVVDGITVATTLNLTGNNATVTPPIFRVTGTVEIRGLWGVVTTAVGVNHTTAFWRLNDQAATIAITLATGTTLSGIAAGSVITKKGLVGAALAKLDNAAGVVSEPTTLETPYFSPFVMVKKTAAQTDIEYSYATTDTPTTGQIQFFCRYIPLSADGKVVGVGV